MPLFNVDEKKRIPSKLLSDKFVINPFSVLHRRSGTWDDRRRYWESLGISGIDGREVKRNNAMPINVYGARTQIEPERTSSFDPVLCELMYKWFSKSGDKIIDPFAGGSVRGIIASLLGREYTGIDLSQQQVYTNYEQYHSISKKFKREGYAEWETGDSEFQLDKIEDGTYQMLFTCPPYYNLEKYTEDLRDLSRQDSYNSFLIKYTSILNKAVSKLDTSVGCFAVIVVSEIRNPDNGGEYYGLVPDTINIMRQAGLKYYNELILEDPIGSLPLRGPKYFMQSRKIGRMHQNVLIFYKGDLSKIKDRCESLNIEF